MPLLKNIWTTRSEFPDLWNNVESQHALRSHVKENQRCARQHLKVWDEISRLQPYQNSGMIMALVRSLPFI
jgi:hypothetical protein